MNLIIKDFKLIKKVVLFGLVYSILLAILQGSSKGIGFFNEGFGSIYTLYMTYFSFTNSNSYDDKNKAYMIINSLPIDKSKVVISKYLSIACYSIFYYAFFSLCCFVVNLFAPFTSRPFNLLLMIILLLINLLIYGIQYPLYFKYGTKFLHIFRLMGLFIIFIFPSIIAKFIKSTNFDTLPNILQWIIHNQALSLLVFSLIVIVVTFLTMNVSIRIYTNKDFA